MRVKAAAVVGAGRLSLVFRLGAFARTELRLLRTEEEEVFSANLAGAAALSLLDRCAARSLLGAVFVVLARDRLISIEVTVSTGRSRNKAGMDDAFGGS